MVCPIPWLFRCMAPMPETSAKTVLQNVDRNVILRLKAVDILPISAQNTTLLARNTHHHIIDK